EEQAVRFCTGETVSAKRLSAFVGANLFAKASFQALDLL
ncbi:hypothetical protein PSYAR_08741, partial [Pseudomonas syringae pv. aceris str. M302273]